MDNVLREHDFEEVKLNVQCLTNDVRRHPADEGSKQALLHAAGEALTRWKSLSLIYYKLVNNPHVPPNRKRTLGRFVNDLYVVARDLRKTLMDLGYGNLECPEPPRTPIQTLGRATTFFGDDEIPDPPLVTVSTAPEDDNVSKMLTSPDNGASPQFTPSPSGALLLPPAPSTSQQWLLMDTLPPILTQFLGSLLPKASNPMIYPSRTPALLVTHLVPVACRR